MSTTHKELLSPLVDLALKAGARVDEIYRTDFDADVKGDGSAVTQADRISEEIILAGLHVLCPEIPVLAEEAASEGKIPALGNTFFLVDPLDGTREFISRNGEFTINIALIEKGAPTLGVVYAPGCSKLYFGSADAGAFMEIVEPGARRAGAAKPIKARRINRSDLVAVASRSHRAPETEEFLNALGVRDFSPAGSSLKFCLIAEGLADVYPRLGRTMEWDTAAGHAVLAAAGGAVHVLENGVEKGALTYNKKERGFDNPHFVAWGAR